MWNNSGLGKFVNKYVVPVAKVGSLLVGGFGFTSGVVGKLFMNANKIVGYYDNIRNLPDYVKGKILSNPWTDKMIKWTNEKVYPFVDRGKIIIT